MTEPLSRLARIRVVLARPSHPGNIGATARAMKTMGLSRLMLVAPQRFPHAEATALAANATDVLDAATVCSDLPQALQGTSAQFAFTARSRALSHAPQAVREAAAEVLHLAAASEVALVFGNETYGLSNEEVMCCNHLATIPVDPDCSSLNLAAAVQVAVYELRLAALANAVDGEPSTGEEGIPASHEEVERFYVHLEQSMVGSGFLQPQQPRRLMERLRRLYGRVALEKEEVSILRGMLTAWDQVGKYKRR